MRRLSNRLDRLEEALLSPLLDDGDIPQLIVIAGGLPDGLHATIGDVRIEPGADETLDDFRSRALDTAAMLGRPFAVIGG
jgi:hypothetical protein